MVEDVVGGVSGTSVCRNLLNEQTAKTLMGYVLVSVDDCYVRGGQPHAFERVVVQCLESASPPQQAATAMGVNPATLEISIGPLAGINKAKHFQIPLQPVLFFLRFALQLDWRVEG